MLSIFLLPQLFLGGTGQHILYKDKVLGQGRVEPSGLLWTCSSPGETSPREGTLRGLASEHPSHLGPLPTLPPSSSLLHILPPTLPPVFQAPCPARWKMAVYTHPHFLPDTPIPLCLIALGFLPIRALSWGVETNPNPGLGLHCLFRVCVRVPWEPPKQGAGGYIEAFRGQLRPGSQTALLGSLGLPHGHTSTALRRGCPKPAGKGLTAESRI